MGKRTGENAIRYVLNHINDRPRTIVAKAAGISLSNLYRIIHANGGLVRSTLYGRKSDLVEKLTELYPTHSGVECAKILGVDKSTVSRWAVQLGLKHNEDTEQRIIQQRDSTLQLCRKNIDVAKRARTWKRRRKMDELRVLSGQEQKTKFKIKFLPRRLYLAMYYLSRKYGYKVIDSKHLEMMRPPDWGEEKYYFIERHFGQKHKITFYDYVDEEGDSDDCDRDY